MEGRIEKPHEFYHKHAETNTLCSGWKLYSAVDLALYRVCRSNNCNRWISDKESWKKELIVTLRQGKRSDKTFSLRKIMEITKYTAQRIDGSLLIFSSGASLARIITECSAQQCCCAIFLKVKKGKGSKKCIDPNPGTMVNIKTLFFFFLEDKRKNSRLQTVALSLHSCILIWTPWRHTYSCARIWIYTLDTLQSLFPSFHFLKAFMYF